MNARSLTALWALAVVMAFASACSGGGGNSGPQPYTGTQSAPRQTTSVRISIPSATSTNSKLRRAKYVSTATNGATLTVYPVGSPSSATTVAIDLSSNSTACTTNNDGSRSCSVSVSALVGSDDFVFNAYDQAPVSGTIPANAHLLSTSGPIAFTVGLSSTTPTLSLVLNGVVSSLSISPSSLVIPLVGTSVFSISVDALDANGAFIVGPGSYVDANGNAVTISLSTSGDSNNELTLSTNSATAPGATVTATYSGGGVAETPTITASATGFTSVTLSAQITSTANTIAVATATPTPMPSSATATPTPTPTPTISVVPVHDATKFNHASIASGDTIWFTSVVTASGVSSSGATVNMTNGSITFTSNGTSYTVTVPTFTLIFSTTETDSTVSYSSVTNSWTETVPSTFTGSALLVAVSFPVTSALASAINPVTWTASFTTSQPSGLSLQWAWRAGVYPTFNTDYTQLDVKPVDASTILYANSDKPGTPESYKTNVVKGGTGNGGSDYTGDSGQSPTVTVTPTYVAPL